VHKDAAKRIRKDSRARIGSASIVYGKVVEISMGSPNQPSIAAGDFISADEASTMSAIVDSTTLVIEGLHRVISKIDRGQGAFSTMLNEPLELRQTLNNLSIASDRLVRILERIDRGKSPLGVMISDSTDFRKTVRDIQVITANLKDVTTNMKNNDGALGKLINDPKYGQETMTALHTTVQALSSITAKIDTGAGTLGLLINDRELYDGMRDVVAGTKKSPVTRWLIQNRRKSGEKERLKSEEEKSKIQPSGKDRPDAP
jgi:phospholipid/cholesterol/gamma-HCH transport system substrate-binding protein